MSIAETMKTSFSGISEVYFIVLAISLNLLPSSGEQASDALVLVAVNML